ncbi:UPF0175 family protein [Algoriphagus marincola]|jgi:predicted HTH domain antitoxin|uniref:UPF0175 family protein n=1 Tax=Algoriphagus marincola TaxID=264027 RepID=A0ABS7N5N4_9BACT|nr:UPF0175 family protein [Algoriphagus marincola]MBY5951646.1 UPF0175 family protein [Algoriphagus marincola]
MKTITLSIPDFIDIDSKEALQAIAAHLYGAGKLSLGQAADLVNLPKVEFMNILTRFNISVFNYSHDELDSDFEAIKDHNS